MDTITVEFKSVKLKIPQEGLTLETLEQMIFDISRSVAQAALVKALNDYDSNLSKSRTRGLYKNLGRRQKKLQTIIGEILYKRRAYRKKNSGLVYLLDEALKLSKNQRLSLRLKQLFTLLANLGPYRAAQESLSKLTGLFRSHENIRLHVIKEGRRIEQRRNQEIQKIKALDYKIPDEIPEVVYTEADSTYIRKQNKGKNANEKHLEVKIGIGYTGKEPRYKSGRLMAKKLSQRFIMAGIKDTRDVFLDKLSCKAEEKYALSLAKESYFGGDGDLWIRKGKDQFFSRCKYLLCPFHLYRRLREAISHDKEAQLRIKKLLNRNKIDQVLTEIASLIQKTTDKKQKEALKEFLGYILNNRLGIENSMTIRTDKAVKCAGAIEPNIDKTIAHRFKGRGMSWSLEGAEALLKIRETILNGEWDTWWERERGQRIEITSAFKELLSAKQLTKRQNTAPYIEAVLPAFQGPDQTKPWVGVLRKLLQSRLPA
jgi:hypothetical protein